MKKAFTLLVLIVIPTLAFAQGQIAIANSATSLVQQQTTYQGSTNVPVPVGGGHVQFLAAPDGTPFTPLVASCGWPNFRSMAEFLAANPGWNAYDIVPIGPVPGRFVGPIVTVYSPLTPGGNIEYVTIGWTGPFATFDTALAASRSGNAFLGESALVTGVATGDPTTIPPGIPTLMSASYPGMTLWWPPLDVYFRGFTAQPTNQTLAVGATVTFYVEADDACPLPSYYQWYFNGVSIPRANSANYQISNVQLRNTGAYCVVLSNAAWLGPWFGSVIVSSNAILTVLAPPSITQPPQSQTAYEGSTVDFQVSATGSAPLGYQWFFNTSQALAGDTDFVLQLTNVQAAQAGAYTLVVTNAVGALTSPPAVLSVIPPVGQRIVPGLVLLGQPGSLLTLEDADAVGPASGWVTLDRVTLAHTPQWYFDVSEPLPPQRFYRTWQTNGPSAIPALSLYMVPAVSLTGSIGHSVQVDAINQFGPTDAWVTLAAVTLTNTSQLYFDTSARGQPARLYRVVPLP